MNILLNLTIKRRWFDMIASGEKREEYRSLYDARVRNASGIVVNGWPIGGSVMVLRNGYRMDSRSVAVRVIGFSIRLGAVHPEWGEPNYPHYAISFDEIVSRSTYAEVKEALEKKKQETERMKR